MTHGPLSWRELVERDKQKSEDARGQIKRAAMPVQAEPVAWLYVRRADAWPPAPPRVSLTRWPEDGATRDYWDEHALGIIPTPPAGGSDD